VKEYILKLTSADLAAVDLEDDGGGSSLDIKLRELAKKALADRRAENPLRLPWRAVRDEGNNLGIGRGDYLYFSDSEGRSWCPSLEAARLAAAAPEMKAVLDKLIRLQTGSDLLSPETRRDDAQRVIEEIGPLVEKVRRKLETGVPE
jgi:hypothetical protein